MLVQITLSLKQLVTINSYKEEFLQVRLTFTSSDEKMNVSYFSSNGSEPSAILTIDSTESDKGTGRYK